MSAEPRVLVLREYITWRQCAKCRRAEPCDIIDGGPHEHPRFGAYRLTAALCGRCQMELGKGVPLWVRTHCLALQAAWLVEHAGGAVEDLAP